MRTRSATSWRLSAAAQAEDPPPTLLPDTLATAASIACPAPRHPLLLIAQPMLAHFGGDLERMQHELSLLGDHPYPWVARPRMRSAGTWP